LHDVRMIITLTTDFGLADSFVGAMKGVILGLAPDVTVVDLTHQIDSYDVFGGAYALAGAFRSFPAGTIHVAVVDPGVGGRRRPIAAAAEGHVFVGPDNGVLSLALSAGEQAPVAHCIDNAAWFRHPVSQTFHGRDIFAPTAARLARGEPLERCGPRIEDFAREAFPRPRRRPRRGAITAWWRSCSSCSGCTAARCPIWDFGSPPSSTLR
jgi:S-adenosylmethionine hydrolase